jgi:hypothetical protein
MVTMKQCIIVHTVRKDTQIIKVRTVLRTEIEGEFLVEG